MLINTAQFFDGRCALRTFFTSDEHSVSKKQIVDGSSFRQEFRVGQYLIGDSGLVVGAQNVEDAFGGSNGNCALFDHYLVALGYVGDHASSAFHVFQVGCSSLPLIEECLGVKVNFFTFVDD